MKKVITIAVIYLLIVAFFYCCGAFIRLSFNPAKWAEEGRVMFAFICFATLVLTGAIKSNFFQDKN